MPSSADYRPSLSLRVVTFDRHSLQPTINLGRKRIQIVGAFANDLAPYQVMYSSGTWLNQGCADSSCATSRNRVASSA